MTRPEKSLQFLDNFIDSPVTNLHFLFNPKIALLLHLPTEAVISSAGEQLMRNKLVR